jgi:hypothetical protein
VHASYFDSIDRDRDGFITAEDWKRFSEAAAVLIEARAQLDG